MTIIELIAAFFSLISVYYSVKNNKLLWPAGIIGIAAYMYVFFVVRLYADFSLQIIYLGQSVFGWWFWLGGKKKEEPPIGRIPEGMIVLYLIGIISGIYFLTTILVHYTNASAPLLDATASVLSLIANWLLAKRRIENWFYWISADVVYIGLFYYKELYISMILYGIFLIMAIRGYIEWRKKLPPTEEPQIKKV